MSETVSERLALVEQNINSACERAGRIRSEITLVAVSKTFPAAAIDEAVVAGATDIGENKVQEAESKFSSLSSTPRFHLIGHLQSNKSKVAASLFDVVQTIDSLKLASRLDAAAEEQQKRLEILVQVNVGMEAQKYGVSIEEAPPLARELLQFEHLELTGLMTIPPLAGEVETRRYYSQLRDLRDTMKHELGLPSFHHLSMGMSSDYGIAIEEGATIVRVGTAIFGSRD